MTDAATDWRWWLMYAQILFTWWNIVILSVVFFDVVISNCQHIPLEWIMTVMTLISVILVPFQHLTVISVSVLFTLKSQQLAVSFYYLHHHCINGPFLGELRVVLAIFPSVSFFVQIRTKKETTGLILSSSAHTLLLLYLIFTVRKYAVIHNYGNPWFLLYSLSINRHKVIKVSTYV